MENKRQSGPVLSKPGFFSGAPAAGEPSAVKNRPAAESAGSGRAKAGGRLVVPLVFCADADYGAYLAVVVESLLAVAAPEHDYHIIVFDCGIKQQDLRALAQKLAAAPNFCLHIRDISDWLQRYQAAFSVADGRHLSAAAYGRLLIPDLCPAYDIILYADIDMIFRRDPAALMAMAPGDNYIAGVVDTNIEKERRRRAGVRAYYRKKLGLRDDQAYINSGLLVFNSRLWRERGLVEQCLAILQAQQFRRHDQDMINFICKDKIRYIGAEWNVYCNLSRPAAETGGKRKKAAIYHFVGAVKPWHKPPERHIGPGALWWDYARQTDSYQQFLYEAEANKAGLNDEIGRYSYSLFGLPVWRLKIYPKKRKYFLFGLAVATEKLDSKRQQKILYILGFRLLRRRLQPGLK